MTRGTRLLVVVVIVLLLITVSALQFALFRATGGGAAAQTPSSTRTITALGHGDVEVQPDRATLTVGADTKNVRLGASLGENNAALTSIVGVLEKMGIARTDIQSTMMSVYQDGQSGQYDVTQAVTVQVNNISTVSTILQQAAAAGANTDYGISFSVKNPASAHAQALRLALADARTRAGTMARDLGLRIGSVQTVSEGTGTGTVGVPCTQGCGGGGGPVQTGQSTISADVTVTYSTTS